MLLLDGDMDTYSTKSNAEELDDGSVEFHAQARNQHGTGFNVVVSNPLAGRVDIELYQVVGHEVPDEPSVSLSLPVNAAVSLLHAINSGTTVAQVGAKLKKYH